MIPSGYGGRAGRRGGRSASRASAIESKSVPVRDAGKNYLESNHAPVAGAAGRAYSLSHMARTPNLSRPIIQALYTQAPVLAAEVPPVFRLSPIHNLPFPQTFPFWFWVVVSASFEDNIRR